MTISPTIRYAGVNDHDIDLFEGQYKVPRGMAYNSYVILDDKTAVMDTVDARFTHQWLDNVQHILDGRSPDYLIVQHMEPDHSANIDTFMKLYPQATIVSSAKAFAMMLSFFGTDYANRRVVIKDGDTLTLGAHTLTFVGAPMVHWPEVMVTFDATTGILFSADAFGCFGALDGNMYADQVNFKEKWLDEARRYYCNIVGKYGPQVQDVLAKASTLDISMLCSTHGPIWREDLGWIIDKYDKWSSYTPEDEAVVIFYGSIYGGTENAANILASQLSQAGVNDVKVYDVSKTHGSYLIGEAFRASHLVFCSATYNMGIFTPMKNFLNDLVAHNMQNRKVSFVENGTWSPASGQLMQDIVATMPDMVQVGDLVTIRSTPNAANVEELTELAGAIAASLSGDESVGTAVATSDNAEPAAGTVEAAEKASDVVTTWKCTVCGYIYECEGEELPADFVCPLCGKDATFFELVEE